MLKNITLKIDDALLSRVRHVAVDEDKSVSAWVADLIEKSIQEKDDFQQARKDALRRLSKGYSLGNAPIRREAVYER